MFLNWYCCNLTNFTHCSTLKGKIKQKRHLGESIQEWTKWDLWKAAFKKFYLVHSLTLCPIWNRCITDQYHTSNNTNGCIIDQHCTSNNIHECIIDQHHASNYTETKIGWNGAFETFGANCQQIVWVFDHFVKLALKGLIQSLFKGFWIGWLFHLSWVKVYQIAFDGWKQIKCYILTWKPPFFARHL